MPQIGTPIRLALILFTGFLPNLATTALAQNAPAAQPSPRDPYADHIAEAAQRFELPAAWIRAVMTAESNGDPRAISPKGAIGLMQIMPATWRDLRARHRLGADPYGPHDNIIAGAAYIRQLFDRYGSPGWIAAYNAGPGRYEASLKGRSLPPETRAYLTAVASHLDGAGDRGDTVIATADPLSWTRAPLFVVQGYRVSAADSARNGTPPKVTSSTPTVRDVSAIMPQPGGLFVARADAGRQP
ncbi:lytic transglycosylase domain-containing protein [Bosea massiliensis]|uniref:Lytic transglycosylase domain-containing protein n=1 Tax=Bosea massiliensis TaxID=151419 RepID=A0ABW0P6T8_9HYPH